MLDCNTSTNWNLSWEALGAMATFFIGVGTIIITCLSIRKNVVLVLEDIHFYKTVRKNIQDTFIGVYEYEKPLYICLRLSNKTDYTVCINNIDISFFNSRFLPNYFFNVFYKFIKTKSISNTNYLGYFDANGKNSETSIKGFQLANIFLRLNYEEFININTMKVIINYSDNKKRIYKLNRQQIKQYYEECSE
jgi:hypothetical protein